MGKFVGHFFVHCVAYWYTDGGDGNGGGRAQLITFWKWAMSNVCLHAQWQTPQCTVEEEKKLVATSGHVVGSWSLSVSERTKMRYLFSLDQTFETINKSLKQ